MRILYNGIPAEIRSAARSGYWNVWAVNPDDAPFGETYSGLRFARPLEERISTSELARRYPEHAESLRARPDSSD